MQELESYIQDMDSRERAVIIRSLVAGDKKRYLVLLDSRGNDPNSVASGKVTVLNTVQVSMHYLML